MNKKYIPFDRYHWDLSALFLEYEIQSALNPISFGTSKEEVDWYVKALLDAQQRYRAFHTKWEQRIIFAPLFICIILGIIVGVLIGWFHIIMSFSTYIIYYMVGFYIAALWGWIAYKYKIADKILNHYFRKMFYPSVLPNVERFLSYCFVEKFSRENPINEKGEILSYRNK